MSNLLGLRRPDQLARHQTVPYLQHEHGDIITVCQNFAARKPAVICVKPLII